MKNAKVEAFRKKVAEKLHLQKLSLDIQTKENIEALKNILLIPFSNEKPFIEDTKNLIFFTYSNHYRGNSGVYQSVCSLHNPHENYEDRGYIKGTATDLNGYLALKDAKMMNHNIEIVLPLYLPKFRVLSYQADVVYIMESAIKEMDQYRNQKIEEINQYLKSVSGCSLLHYIQNI